MMENKGFFGGGLGPLVYLADNWISRVGIALTTTGGIAWLFTLPAHFGAGGGHPYLALLSVFALPAIFLLGLALIPLGIRLKEKRQRKAGVYPSSFPPPSWANPEFRKLISFIGLATAANVIIGSHLTYSAIAYMDSSSFCGQACHIMEPEFTAWQVAPHSQVDCVDCHIGAGAANLVAAKLNGAKQLIQVLTNTYPTPVPTPVHNLAQGDLTCGSCHSDRDLGMKRKEWVRFASDEANTATRTEVLLAIGGGANPKGAHGAHMANGAWIEYRSNEKRTEIPWMRYTAPDGVETVFAAAAWSDDRARDMKLRTMDCTDCHNRAAHSFEVASEAIDEALAKGLIDANLSFVKREGLKAVEAGYLSREEAREKIPAAITTFYGGQGGADRAAVERAGAELLAIYERNVFPRWGVDWETHPNFNGHENNPGCFRCHDAGLVSQNQQSRRLSDDCSACHLIVADGQPVSAPQARTTLTSTGGSGMPGTFDYSTPAGAASFNHAEHVNYESGDCTACHNSLFPMSRAPLNYGDNLHRTAEANHSSCAGCHVSGGKAFASADNCARCHSGLSEPRRRVASAAPAPVALPGLMSYATSLGQAEFDHAEHVDLADGRCQECHNTLFEMGRGNLAFGGLDMHKGAEAANSSCAGCHAPGGAAFAAADNCARCHVGLGEPKPTPVTGVSGIPSSPAIDTRLGPARFDHDKHIELADNNCQACHNQIFPLAKGLLGYKDNLHKTAEAASTSCGACHRPGGEAFGSENNCLKCHADASAQALGSAMGLPDLVQYANRLGAVAFNHDQHIVDAKGECGACHPGTFEMKSAGSLPRYSNDYHREAEAAGTSCAKCHSPKGESFGTLNNCTRCHEGLELNRQASLFASPWMFLLLLAMPLTATAQERGGYVGSKRCEICHAEQSHGFEGNPHALLATSERWEAQEIACESCHGPGLAHVQSLDPEALAVWANSQPDRVNQACLECHSAGTKQAGRFFSDHVRNEVACTGCHQAHDAPARPLLSAKTDVLCSSCHAEVSAAFRRPYKHKLHEGTISCVDCHDPHGQSPVAGPTRVSVNETACYNCHGDKRGPFPFEHAPVKMEPCSTCHEPHGSANPRMMVRHNVAQLCLECHTTSLAALGGSPPAFHDLRSARFRACTTCHSKIHGSFVSRDFLR